MMRSEVQIIRTASLAANSSSDSIVGSFRLSWGDGGEKTDYLPANIGEMEFEAALEALVNVRDVQARVPLEAQSGLVAVTQQRGF